MDSPSTNYKKHRKHKKKHRHRHDDEEDDSVDVVLSSPSNKPAIKLKFKLGGQTFAETSVLAPEDLSMTSMSCSQDVSSLGAIDDDDNDTSQTPSVVGNDTSDEEKEWLEALETGNLDDWGMLKRSRDPNLMTARQRALVHGVQEENLQELPSGYKTPELTEEQLQRRQQRANKRRQVAIEKREKDKKLIMDRLLKKQEAKLRVAKSRATASSQRPRYRYTNNTHQITVSVPVGYDLPFQQQTAQQPPPPQHCGVAGCKNLKKYSCSKTGVALCSLECYRHNLSLNTSPSVATV